MDTFAANHGLTAETTGQLQLAMEEMVTNVIKYGYAGEPGNRIDLEFALCSDEVVLRVKDSGPAFTPPLVAPPNLDLPPEQKKPGGLAIHLVKKMMDRLEYERVGNKNHLTIRKRIK